MSYVQPHFIKDKGIRGWLCDFFLNRTMGIAAN
jgi:hypothetical protein